MTRLLARMTVEFVLDDFAIAGIGNSHNGSYFTLKVKNY